MDVESIVEALGLDPARIVAKASATEDYARILLERAAEDTASAAEWRLRAASAETIAGSLWMLVRPKAASTPLGHAEDIHAASGSAYGSLLSICAHPHHPTPPHELPNSIWGSSSVEPGDVEHGRPLESPLMHIQPAASLLAHLWPLAAGHTDQSLEQLLSDTPILATLSGSRLTGRLRIPLGHYRGLAEEIDRLRHADQRSNTPVRSRLPNAGAFIARAAEVISAARENANQWRTLRSPILPAEPEIIAACALVEMCTRDTLGISAIDAMRVPRNSLAGALMGIAENLVEIEPTAEFAW